MTKTHFLILYFETIDIVKSEILERITIKMKNKLRFLEDGNSFVCRSTCSMSKELVINLIVKL